MRWTIYIVFIFLLISCRKDHTGKFETMPYVEEFPSYFPTMPVLSDNPSTVEGVELGRMLYYDNILHPNQEMSCSSCHDQSSSFTTYSSNSLAHINIGWANTFLWNGKVEGTLEDIMRFEVEDFFATDINALNEDPDYPLLFNKAFGVNEITSREVAYALAQFFRTLNSYNSKYDRKILGMEDFTPQEWNGYDIFFTERGDCFHCHGTALFTDNLFHNNALDSFPDLGRMEVSNNSADRGKFKSPTLRNVEFTAPYMHDGRYQTLEEVVDFYCNGLQWSSTADPLMKNISSGGIDLSPQDRLDLVAFLRALSDASFLTNPALSNPF